jgi:hypothetical protein
MPYVVPGYREAPTNADLLTSFVEFIISPDNVTVVWAYDSFPAKCKTTLKKKIRLRKDSISRLPKGE